MRNKDVEVHLNSLKAANLRKKNMLNIPLSEENEISEFGY